MSDNPSPHHRHCEARSKLAPFFMSKTARQIVHDYMNVNMAFKLDFGLAYGEGWNLGPKDENAKPVSWIEERLTQAWGEGASWKLDNGDQPHEAHYLKLDSL